MNINFKKLLPSYGTIDSIANETKEIEFDANLNFPREIQRRKFEKNITIELIK